MIRGIWKNSFTARSTIILGVMIQFGAAAMLYFGMMDAALIAQSCAIIATAAAAMSAAGQRQQAAADGVDARVDLRLKAALDACKTNVMIADESNTIIYTNNTMMDTMQGAEADLRKELPGFTANNLIGASIDTFHKNPSHQHKMLAGLTRTVETDIAVAGRSFHLVVTPIFDANGERLGNAVEWKDETAEKAIEIEIDQVVSAAAAGDLSGRVPLDGKHGFMLALAKSINELSENLEAVTNDLVRMFSALAGGDFTSRISGSYHGEFNKLATDANAMAERIGSTIGEIKIAAERVSVVSVGGGEVVGKATGAMARIEESSRKIADIIVVIDEIAQQTNLLALNAAVEAARAGEAGRGFAVVASEVRSLAVRSAQAAKDIKGLITNSSTQVTEGVDLVNQAGGALNEIVGSIKTVADIIDELAAHSAGSPAKAERAAAAA